ncbi:MAG TPA: tetratricopeptide repeat protein [Polyangiaceae bacterium]|nr:tetratricopeptide repeat protein [Polyangiaceae bacterium]
MAKPVGPVERIGRDVAHALEQHSAHRQKAIERARRAFLEKHVGLASDPGIARRADTRRVETRRWLGWASAAALVLCSGLAVMVWTRDERALSFAVNGQHGRVDTWLGAKVKPVVLTFSDGTALQLEHASQARVVEVTPHGARIALESGILRAEVVHTEHSTWQLVAGPLMVVVTGTRFEMKWNPSLEEFTILVSEGSVRVSGSVAGAGRAVRAGEKLFVSVREDRLELTGSSAKPTLSAVPIPPAPPAPVPEAPIQAQPLSQQAARPRSELSQHLAKPSIAPKNAVPDWQALLGSGELRAAFANAEQTGFQKVCETASAGELLGLGDAARVSGRPDRASEALLTLRRRFPGDTRSAAAAFALGKVAFDQRHTYAEAASWFATYLREQPRGSLAREASGRYMEALRATGDRVAAGKAARDYLARYPDGAHAELARSLLP